MKVLLNCGNVGETGRQAVIIEKGNRLEYVTCRGYDPEAPVGQQWYGGHYTYSLENFAKLILSETETISYERMAEIAEKAMSFLADNYMLWEFMEDRDIDISDGEDEYFFPKDKSRCVKYEYQI